MELNFYLRLDRISKKTGLAPIRFSVIAPVVPRFFIETNEKCRPEHWEGQLVTGHEPYAVLINEKLKKWRKAMERVDLDFQLRRTPYTKASILEAFNLTIADPIKEEDLTESRSEQFSFFSFLERWKKHQESKVQLRNGKKMAPGSINGINTTISRLKEYEKETGKLLSFAGMNRAFYQDFQNYILITLEQSVNHFGKHISRIKTFLKWCELYHDVEVNRHYQAFEAPSVYKGVDALSVSEIQSLYALDFSSLVVRKQALKHYPVQEQRKIEEAGFQNYLHNLEVARDIFLCCCYTGMRISDASAFTPHDVRLQEEFIVRPATKTTNTCYIPFYDDAVFKPRELVMKYWMQHNTCMPPMADQKVNEYLKTIQQLAKIKRLPLTTKLGRKTFVTLKLYQGVPSRMVMQATGHKTELSFNRYAGINTQELSNAFRRGSETLVMQAG